jgi:hypothetical protein
MLFVYCFLLLILLSIIFMVIRSLVLRKTHISVELFARALQNENSGQYEEAVVLYESALTEVEKIKFHSGLRNKIIEKLKLLHTIVDYQKSHRIK